MRITIAGSTFRGHRERSSGTYRIAYDITTAHGKRGEALLVYEFDERDVILEKLFVTPGVADEVRRNTLPREPACGDSPCCSGFFPFPEAGEENRNVSKVVKAKRRCTELIYEA